jgi:hypothetical protein
MDKHNERRRIKYKRRDKIKAALRRLLNMVSLFFFEDQVVHIIKQEAMAKLRHAGFGVIVYCGRGCKQY